MTGRNERQMAKMLLRKTQKAATPAAIVLAMAVGLLALSGCVTPQVVREVQTAVPLGEGHVRWKEYKQALDDHGYTGPFVIEREVGTDPVKDILAAKALLEAL